MMRKMGLRTLEDGGGMKTHGQTLSRLKFCFALGLAFLWVPGGVSAQTAADPGLQPGDKVSITVWQRDELSGDFTVAPDGSLNHPLYRQVRVTGVPASQVEERVKSFLIGYEANPQVVVQPLYRVTIAGPVMRPDIYDLPPGTTVSQAVNRAGGVMDEDDRDDVLLIRGTTEFELDLTQAETIQMPVQSGDQILVESSGGGFRQTVMPFLQLAMTAAHFIFYATDNN